MQQTPWMERIERSSRPGHDQNGTAGMPGEGGLREPGIGELFRRMTDEASLLARQEIQLAKAELRESAANAKQAAVKLALAALLALPGAMALTAFLVVVFAGILGSWWASALMVGTVLVAAAGLLVGQGVAGLRKGKVGLRATADSLAEGARWGKQEVKVFRNE